MFEVRCAFALQGTRIQAETSVKHSRTTNQYGQGGYDACSYLSRMCYKNSFITINAAFTPRPMTKGQGSRRVKIGPVADIYDFLICYRIIYLMKKNVIFICFALKLCNIEADKYPQRFCNVRQRRLRNKLTSETSQRHPNNFTAYCM